MSNSRLIRVAALGATLVLLGASAQAAPLFDFRSAGAAFAPTRDTLGYAFTVSASTTVDGIGMLDFGGDGLDSAHQVALWDNSNPAVKLRSEILNPGTPTAGSDPSISGLGSYIYVDIAALVLNPGTTYVLGASFLPANANKDAAVIGATGIVSDSGVATLTQGRLGPATGIDAVFPGLVRGSADRYFGPNLRIAMVTVSEPLTLALLAAGMVGIGLGLRNSASRTRLRVDALAA